MAEQELAFIKDLAKFLAFRVTTESDTSLEGMGPGLYYVAANSHATTLGLPSIGHGLLIIVNGNSGLGAAFWLPRIGAGRIFTASRNAFVWGAWIS